MMQTGDQLLNMFFDVKMQPIIYITFQIAASVGD